MKQKIFIVKVGGGIVEQEETLGRLLNDFSRIEGAKVLVHGGGRSATRIAAQLGIESKMVDGRRVTDADMLRVVTMVYGGLVNKTLVAGLQARGVNALGLTGADCNVMRSHRRPPTPTVDYGFVGDVDACDGDMLANLIQRGVTPVLAPLTHDGQGSLLNTNADTIASTAAKALAAVKDAQDKPLFEVTLVFCFEKAGVLSNPDDEGSVIPHIDAADFERLVADGTIQGGMIPKIQNALEACRAGVSRVIITHADNLSKSDQGTEISL